VNTEGCEGRWGGEAGRSDLVKPSGYQNREFECGGGRRLKTREPKRIEGEIALSSVQSRSFIEGWPEDEVPMKPDRTGLFSHSLPARNELVALGLMGWSEPEDVGR